MRKLWAFLPGLLFYVPFGAMAVHPGVLALLAGGVAVAGFSIFLSFFPVDLNGALSFFSSCWSCRMFSDILGSLSELIPKIYAAVGENIVPIAAGLTFVWFAWRLVSDYIKVKAETNAWQFAARFGTHLIKLAFVAALLIFPLPRFIMDTFIAPIMNVGLSYNHVAKNNVLPDSGFYECVVATAMDERSVETDGAFAPKLRHNMACQIAGFHQLTGLGMAVGWTFMGMSFNVEYSYVVLPNIMLLLAGFAILMVFFGALIPVPIYFVKTFIKLSMDLIMLPLMLLGWLFGDWKGVFPKGKNIKGVVEDAVKDACGIALVGLFAGFAVLFLNEMIGSMNGTPALVAAMERNDSAYLMDALTMNNDSVVNLILAGIFIFMFMNAIPKLVEELFKNAKIPDAKPIQDAITGAIKDIYDLIKVKGKVVAGVPTGTSSGGTGTAAVA